MRTTLAKVKGLAWMALAGATTWLQQWVCSLHGHDAMVALDPNRVALRCPTCGFESPGWDLTDLKPPRPMQAGIPRRH
jgi:hypothetical protein